MKTEKFYYELNGGSCTDKCPIKPHIRIGSYTCTHGCIYRDETGEDNCGTWLRCRWLTGKMVVGNNIDQQTVEKPVDKRFTVKYWEGRHHAVTNRFKLAEEIVKFANEIKNGNYEEDDN